MGAHDTYKYASLVGKWLRPEFHDTALDLTAVFKHIQYQGRNF